MSKPDIELVKVIELAPAGLGITKINNNSSKFRLAVSSIDNSVKIFDIQRESNGILTYSLILNSNNLEYNPAADDDSMAIDAGNDSRQEEDEAQET